MEKEDEISEEKEINTEEPELIDDKKEMKEEVEKETIIEKKEEFEIKEVAEKNETKVEKQIEEKLEKNDIEIKPKKKKNLIIIPVLIIILMFLSTIFAITNMNSSNIIKGVYIENLDISNQSKEKINDIINEKIMAIENVELYYNDYNEIIKIEDLGIEVSAKNAINNAIMIGKSENIIIDNFNILKSMLLKTKLELDININEEKFNEMAKNIQAEIPGKIEEYSYEIKEDKLIITNGKDGKIIITEELKEIIIKNIKNQFNEIYKTSEVPVKYSEPE